MQPALILQYNDSQLCLLLLNKVTMFKISTSDGIMLLISVSEMPSDMMLEGLNESKLENSVQLQTVMALYDPETARAKEPNYHKLKTAVKTSH